MKVAITPTYGAAEIIQIGVAALPVVAPGQLLIQVRASPVTAGDRRVRSADFPGASAVIGRLALGITGPRHAVQGTMFAGRVSAVGEGVTRFAVGDAVFGSVDHGAYAEQLVISESGPVAQMPPGVDYDEAACIPYGAGTALHFLRDMAQVKPGDRVLILGASGGVGRYAVQIADHLGAHVTAVCSRSAFDLVRELGADETVDYRTEDFTQSGLRYDVIFDIADASSFRHSRASLTERGCYLTLYISFDVLFSVAYSALMGGRRAHFSIVLGTQERTLALRDLLQAGVIRPVISERFSLDQVAQAHARADLGVHGEIVVMVPDLERRRSLQAAS